MAHRIIVANPAGNITALVPEGLSFNREERAEFSARLLSGGRFKIEQAGFIIKPDSEGSLWKLEMSGGEFCGNAARCFALYAACEEGRKKNVMPEEISVMISGCNQPLKAFVKLKEETGVFVEGSASIFMPLPKRCFNMNFEGASLPVFEFEGITHIIAKALELPENKEERRALFFYIAKKFEAEYGSPKALGVMFFLKEMMIPAVYVYDGKSFVFESSCGSGTAAYAAYCALEQEIGKVYVEQPGGAIEGSVSKQNGRIKTISIGGKITLEQTQF
ncbi:MAG: diaminopimelate epimerase [Termitinemataceae bacterium]|nr:MAG: diaminopimelate epimerase [Termitinemataceae bacterium]